MIPDGNKPRKPLTRKTPLRPGKALTRKAPPKRSSSFTPPVKKAAPVKKATPKRTAAAAAHKKPARATGPSMAMRRAAKRRDRGRCVRCGAPATNLQHRRARGMGGSRDEDTNRLSLLLSVCGSGTTGCHGWIEQHRTDARALGYAVRRNATVDPEAVPVLTVDGWQLFTDTGQRIPWVPPQGGTDL